MNQIDETIADIYANNQMKLRQLCNKEIAKFGGVFQKDYDDFYSRAGWEIFKAKNTYDSSKGKSFMEYLKGVIRFAIRKEITEKNRKKRCNILETEEEDENGNFIRDKEYIPDISLDMPIGEEGGLTIGEALQSDFDMDLLLENTDNYQDERITEYLDSLSRTTRKIIEMKMEDIPVSTIKQELGLTETEYGKLMYSAKINDNIELFTNTHSGYREEKKMITIIPIDVTDNYRMDKFPLGSLLDDIRDGKINKKHILQRKPFQWTERQKNKFLTRILNGQPIPEIVICEQVINGKKKSHLIDGLQRLSYAGLFRADGIVIKEDGAEFYEIPYKEYKYDNNGDVVLDTEGDAIFEEKVFNVIGKKFSEFPLFIKERMNKFNVNVTTYFNCTDEQIAYHIRNYNNQEGMNKSQYEFTGIDIDMANKIKDISDNHPFFKDIYGKFSNKNKVKGDLDKIVVESIMATNFLENWGKEQKYSFRYVSDNATDEMFISLKNSLDRLCDIVDKEIKNMFTVTNSPVWIAVFERFKKLGVEDKQFKDFVKYVETSLDNLRIENKPFIDIYKNKNARDKAVVMGKINGLISFMYEFLNLSEKDERVKESVQLKAEDFISENVGVDRREVDNNMEIYSETLEDLCDRAIKFGSKLLEKENQLSLLAMVAYSYKNDEDLDEWLAAYASKNNTYISDPKKNYLYMLEDFKRYCLKKISA